VELRSLTTHFHALLSNTARCRFGRITAWNYTHLTYEHVENPTSKVSDEWTIVQSKHGPFDPKDHTFLPPRK